MIYDLYYIMSCFLNYVFFCCWFLLFLGLQDLFLLLCLVWVGFRCSLVMSVVLLLPWLSYATAALWKAEELPMWEYTYTGVWDPESCLRLPRLMTCSNSKGHVDDVDGCGSECCLELCH